MNVRIGFVRSLGVVSAVVALSIAPQAEARRGGADGCFELEEVNVPDPDGGALFTSWYGLNDRGQVVGNYCIAADCSPVGADGDVVGGAIYDERDGSFETFTLPRPYNWVGSVGINNWGVVVGQALVFDLDTGDFTQTAGFLRDRRGHVSILPRPMDSVTEWTAEDINDLGQIVGWFLDPDEGNRSRGYIYQRRLFRRGTFRIYDIADTGQTEINGINNRGDIVGLYADGEDGGIDFVTGFIDKRGARRAGPSRLEFISVPGDEAATARGVNNRRQVVGWSSDALGDPVRDGFFFDDGAVVPIVFPGAVSTRIADINDRGTIVGTFDGFSFGIIGRPTRCPTD